MHYYKVIVSVFKNEKLQRKESVYLKQDFPQVELSKKESIGEGETQVAEYKEIDEQEYNKNSSPQ